MGNFYAGLGPLTDDVLPNLPADWFPRLQDTLIAPERWKYDHSVAVWALDEHLLLAEGGPWKQIARFKAG